MMNCKIIQDLLPLYADECCSEETRRAVEEHLKTCAECRDMLREMQGELPAAQPAAAKTAADRSMKKGIKKLRRRWLASLAAVIILIPLAVMAFNQVHGTGIDYTNLNEIRIAGAFLKELKQADAEGAYRHMDAALFSTKYGSKFTADDIKEKFLDVSSDLLAQGLTEYRLIGVYRSDVLSRRCYAVTYSVTVGGAADEVTLWVSDRGICDINGGNGLLSDPDGLTQLSLFSEYLWQDFNGCYFDPAAGTYIYYDNE